MKRRLSRAFDPPAAILPIAARSPDGDDERTIDGKIDTGADLCALPQWVVGELDLPAGRVVRVTPAMGPMRELVVYRMDCTIGGEPFRYVETVAFERPYAIIGRNVLRELVLRIDGPRETVELKRPLRRK